MKRAARVAFLSALLSCSSHALATEVSGDQSGTWTLAGSPYEMVGDVRVPPGETLAIEPGVTVIALGYYRLTVDQSTLLAIGTPNEAILMTAQDQTTGWRGIRMLAAANDSQVRHCVLEYAKGTGGFPEVRGGALFIKDCSPTI